jgi:type II secretory pathway pseudopilin PulG
MKRQSGFTIIEVTIFLALTSMLFLIAFFGTGVFVQQSRFSDGMRRLESYLQSQYEEVVSGVNPRDSTVTCASGTSNVVPGASSPGTTSCVLLGKLIVFTGGSDTVESYYVVGMNSQAYLTTDPVTTIITSLAPRAADNTNVSTFESPWGIRFVQGKRASSGGPMNAIAFLRSPVSSQVVTYVYNHPSVSAPLAPFISSSLATNTTANFCFVSADNANKVAAVQLGNGQGSSAFSVLFDTTTAASC